MTPQAHGTLTVRYFSPESEVPFCGHATIATAVAYAERHQAADELRFDTPAGRVVRVTDSGDGPLLSSLRRCRRASPTPVRAISCSAPRPANGSPNWTTTSSACAR